MLQLLPVPTPPRADTARAADTLSLSDRLRGDTAWVQQISSPESALDSLRTGLVARVADPALWLGLLGLTLRIALIVLVAHTLVSLIARGARRYSTRFTSLDAAHPRRQRVTTIANLLVSAARYVIWPMAVITVLGEVGVNVAALLATAGIAGLAIGFGAQTLVRDVISGFFLLFDDSLHVGDTVRIGTDEGTVEHMGVRLLKVRKFNGELLMVPAGELRVFGNRSIGFARAIVDVTIPYDRPAQPVLDTMRRVADAWAAANGPVLLDATPEVLALTDFGTDSARARIVARVLPGAQFAAERTLRLDLMRALADTGQPLYGARSLLVMQGSTSPLSPDATAGTPVADAPTDDVPPPAPAAAPTAATRDDDDAPLDPKRPER